MESANVYEYEYTCTCERTIAQTPPYRGIIKACVLIYYIYNQCRKRYIVRRKNYVSFMIRYASFRLCLSLIFVFFCMAPYYLLIQRVFREDLLRMMLIV